MKKKKAATKKKPNPARAMSANDLCKSLAAIAGLHVENEQARFKIYEAIRRLQLLEAAAIEAGLLPQS